MIYNFNERMNNLGDLIYSNFSADQKWDVYIRTVQTLSVMARMGKYAQKDKWNKVATGVQGDPKLIRKQFFDKYKSTMVKTIGRSVIKNTLVGAGIGAAVGAGAGAGGAWALKHAPGAVGAISAPIGKLGENKYIGQGLNAVRGVGAAASALTGSTAGGSALIGGATGGAIGAGAGAFRGIKANVGKNKLEGSRKFKMGDVKVVPTGSPMPK